MDVEGDLALASMDPYLPCADLHGLPREAVAYEVDMLIAKYPNTCVRISYHRKNKKVLLPNFLTKCPAQAV